MVDGSLGLKLRRQDNISDFEPDVIDRFADAQLLACEIASVH